MNPCKSDRFESNLKTGGPVFVASVAVLFPNALHHPIIFVCHAPRHRDGNALRLQLSLTRLIVPKQMLLVFFARSTHRLKRPSAVGCWFRFQLVPSIPSPSKQILWVQRKVILLLEYN